MSYDLTCNTGLVRKMGNEWDKVQLAPRPAENAGQAYAVVQKSEK